MEKSTISSNGEKLLSFLDEKMYDKSFTNEDLVQFIESVGKYLGLQTISNYAALKNISYNGAKMQKNKRIILGVKFIIDNE